MARDRGRPTPSCGQVGRVIVDDRLSGVVVGSRVRLRPERGASGGTRPRSHQGPRSVGRPSLGTIFVPDLSARLSLLRMALPKETDLHDPVAERWITRPIRGHDRRIIVDNGLVGPSGPPVCSSRPEGSAKGVWTGDPIKGLDLGSATGDSIKGGLRWHQGSAPRPGHRLRSGGRMRR